MKIARTPFERLTVLVHFELAGADDFVGIEAVIEVQADPAVEPEIVGAAAVQVGDVPFAEARRSIPGVS
mgnify:CR=1 FL=1